MAIYLDSSALVKLIAEEPESAGVLALVEAAPARLLSSEIAIVEVTRAARRQAAQERAAELLARLWLISIDSSILQLAAQVDPLSLSSLDALHLASAQALRAQVEAFVAYDDRLIEAARAAGLEVRSPS